MSRKKYLRSIKSLIGTLVGLDRQWVERLVEAAAVVSRSMANSRFGWVVCLACTHPVVSLCAAVLVTWQLSRLVDSAC